MNRYKLRAVVEFMREQGWPTTGDSNPVRDIDSVLAWFGLDRLLEPQEKEVVRRELMAIAEAEAFIDRLRLTVPRQD